jgi:lipoprotein-releasing system permease protein
VSGAGATKRDDGARGHASALRTHVGLAIVELVLAAALGMLCRAALGPPHAALGAGLGVLAVVDLARAVASRRERSGTALSLRFGAVSALWVVGAIAQLALGFVCFGLHEGVPRETSDYLVVYLLAGVVTFAVLGASLVLSRAVRVAQGTLGTVRLGIGAIATFVLAAAQISFATVVWLASHDRVSFELDLMLDDSGGSALGSYLTTVDAVAMAQGVVPVLYGAYAVAGVAALLILGAIIATWFLVPLRARQVVFAIVDAIVTAAFVFALYALPFVPPEEHPEAIELPATALAIATLFGIRATLRLMPGLLDAIETTGFRTLVAARMLRAKKSGFLTVIGVLSILAVSFSSCTLSTTLSVMGGFRDDLQQKILGNHAHVVVDREYGNWGDWQPTLDRASAVEGVLGVTPYVAGEVMITSASSLAGAELRGIDPATIGNVTDLPHNMRHGRLEYLSHPERLCSLSADEMSGSLLLPELLGTDEGGDEPFSLPPPDEADEGGLPPTPGHEIDHGSLTREIDDLLREIDRRQGGAPNVRELDAPVGDPSATRREQIADELDEFLIPETLSRTPEPPPSRHLPDCDVLPGLIVGQELARTLRLHVGDEVNVVSPNGELGPTGPVPRTRPFRVAGIFFSGMYEYDMQMAYTDLESAQHFLGTGAEITGLEIRVDDWERAEQAAERVRGAISRDQLRVRSWQEVNRNLFGALALEKLAMFITLGIAILVASFCVIGTLTLMLQEKRRELAILKAMGAEDRMFIEIFLLQGLFIGLLGASSGLGLGYVMCFAAEHLGIHMNPEVYYIDRLPVHVDPLEFTWVGVAAVLVCVLATIYPAILGSRLQPVDELRDR